MSRDCAGFTMLEVLVSILILGFGLLGLAGLQSRLVVAESEMYQRSQALMLLNDMTERLAGAANQLDGSATISAGYGDKTAGGGTTSEDCTATSGAARDLCEWGNALNGSAETIGSRLTGGGAGATGCIQTGANAYTYTVAVAWQGFTNTAAPANDCGSGSYGDEKMRRVVTATVVIPNLTCLAAAC